MVLSNNGFKFYYIPLLKFLICRSFLEERIAFCSQEPSERLNQKWLLEDFPNWLQEMVILNIWTRCASSNITIYVNV